MDFGSHLGTKMEPRTPILEPRSAQDSQTWSQDGPKTPNLEPRWPQDQPRWPQDGSKTPQLGAKRAPRPPNLEPRWAQDPQHGAKMAQHSPKTPQNAPQEPQLEAKMLPKTSNLEPKLVQDPPTWDWVKSAGLAGQLGQDGVKSKMGPNQLVGLGTLGQFNFACAWICTGPL